jgi:hypothetical protein
MNWPKKSFVVASEGYGMFDNEPDGATPVYEDEAAERHNCTFARGNLIAHVLRGKSFVRLSVFTALLDGPKLIHRAQCRGFLRPVASLLRTSLMMRGAKSLSFRFV